MPTQTTNPTTETTNNNDTTAPLTIEEQIVAARAARAKALTDITANTRDVLADLIVDQEDAIDNAHELNQKLVNGLTTSKAKIQTLTAENSELLDINELLKNNSIAMSKTIDKQTARLAIHEEGIQFEDMTLIEGGKAMIGATFNGAASVGSGIREIGSELKTSIVGSLGLLNGSIKQARIRQEAGAEGNLTIDFLKDANRIARLKEKLGASKEETDALEAKAAKLLKELS